MFLFYLLDGDFGNEKESKSTDRMATMHNNNYKKVFGIDAGAGARAGGTLLRHRGAKGKGKEGGGLKQQQQPQEKKRSGIAGGISAECCMRGHCSHEVYFMKY